jgi:hypothetical protein
LSTVEKVKKIGHDIKDIQTFTVTQLDQFLKKK